MKHKNTNLAAVFMAALSVAIATTGCIENGYDLSDIDTETEIKVKDLVLPVNIDPIVLSDIITIEEGSKIKTVNINGHEFYAVEETGKFRSNPVRIPAFEVNASKLSSTKATLGKIMGRKKRRNGRAASESEYKLEEAVNQNLSYKATDINSSINKLTAIAFKDTKVKLDFKMSDYPSIKKIAVSKLVLQVPKGMDIKTIKNNGDAVNFQYDSDKGLLTVKDMDFDNKDNDVAIVFNGIDLASNSSELDSDKKSLDLDTHINILDVDADVTPSPGYSDEDLPKNIDFDIDYGVDSMEANSFSGNVNYDIEGEDLKVDPININDVPAFLEDERTDLILHNPQIYLKINNPVGDNSLSYHSGLQISSHFKNGDTRVMTLKEFKVGHELGDGPYNYVLSPIVPDNVPSEYKKDLRTVEFSDLGQILSGNGLPDYLDLELLDPEIYSQDVADFKLGQSLPCLEGTYTFLAPLALSGSADSGSIIVYSDTADGWYSDDLDALKITSLDVSANVTSTIPLNAKLEIHPLDRNGKLISGVTVTPAEVPAGKKDHPITVTITGTIEHLDGIRIEAIVRPDGNGTPLAPSQNISLANIRAKVNGSYTKKF